MKRRVLIAAEQEPRRNPLEKGFVDGHGIFHPIQASRDYDERILRERAAERKRRGIDVADQQLERRFDRWTRREEEKQLREKNRAKIRAREQKSLDERLYRLTSEREALAEHLRDDPAARYVGLIRRSGEMRGEVGLIPWEQARRNGLDPSKLKKNAIHKDRFGRRYVRWEYGLDSLATEAGYRDGDHFKDAIERSAKDQEKLAKLDGEIVRAERESRRVEQARRNPDPESPSLLQRLVAWLRGND